MSVLVILGLLFFFLLALYLCLFGAKKYLLFTTLRKHGKAANAEVIASKSKIFTHTPVISFVDHNNRRQEGTSKNTIHLSRFHRHRTGDRLPIFYDPNDPSIFVVDQPSDRLMPLFICATGCLFMVLMLYVFIMSII